MYFSLCLFEYVVVNAFLSRFSWPFVTGFVSALWLLYSNKEWFRCFLVIICMSRGSRMYFMYVH